MIRQGELRGLIKKASLIAFGGGFPFVILSSGSPRLATGHHLRSSRGKEDSKISLEPKHFRDSFSSELRTTIFPSNSSTGRAQAVSVYPLAKTLRHASMTASS